MKGSKPDEFVGDSTVTAQDAAALVKRETTDKEGKVRQVAVSADEVLSFRDYGDQVVVVTVDGQKLTGTK